jgi:hypothetical protein
MWVACFNSEPGNPDAYQEDGSGNCSDEFVSDYDTVATALSSMETSHDIDRAQSLVDDFAGKYGTVHCTADVDDDFHLDSTSEQDIDVDSKVSHWNDLISKARLRLETPGRDTVIDPSETIKMTIVNPDILNRVVSQGPTSPMVADGQIVPASGGVDAEVYCSVDLMTSVSSQRHHFQAGESVVLLPTAVSTGLALSTEVSDEGMIFMVNCSRTHEDGSSWTLGDLNEAFNGIATFYLEN